MDTQALLQKLNKFLVKNRLKSTRQRDVIINTFFEMKGQHVRIEELLKAARKKNPAIGYATVYRTLMLLVDAGVANQRHFRDGKSRFEIASAQHHDHLICTECGRIVEFENNTIEDLQERIARKNKFVLTGHKLELYGICTACHKKQGSP